MTISVIIAGGKGQRLNQDIPKQFINVDDKPILIHTLEEFQKHPEVDEIGVVCLDGWHELLRAYCKQFNINKLKWITSGGTTGQESIRNGVFYLRDKCETKSNDIVIIHDGIRPLVDENVLSDVIVKCKQYGNAVTSLPYNEQIFIKKDELTTSQYINRDTLRRVMTPQAYRMDKLIWAYEKAFSENFVLANSSYTNTLMVDLGETLYFAAGSEKNIKITTIDDIALFRALKNIKGN